ncbi:ERF family protein [Cupriavidus taiwanensis]|uniref:ERF family protein n=1 Tax=Cupriavidus taiwanensis TaxID=164546 RepID=UPI000E150E48|nr:ERF family protein [Cupriavidus taiwanensis]SPA44645.1 ERF family protein [Cupriavidus taiwanensis]
MEANKNISAAFVKAQQAFAPALKSSSNPHFKSKYADLAACVEAVIDALNGNGIAVIQRPVLCDNGVTVETVFVHESGETLSGGVLHVPAQKQDAQGYGSALTYCRRYGLMAACGIAPEDDDGNAAVAAQQKPKAQPKQAPAVNMADAAVAIRESEDLDGLKNIFGALYKSATPEQREELKRIYDARKAEIENLEHA